MGVHRSDDEDSTDAHPVDPDAADPRHWEEQTGGLEVIGAHGKGGLVSGMYMLVFAQKVVFCGDTTVNIEPTAEQLAQICDHAIVLEGDQDTPAPWVNVISNPGFGTILSNSGSATTEARSRPSR